MRHVNVISRPGGDPQLQKIAARIKHDEHVVASLDDLAAVIDRIAGEPATLDLTGHSSGNANHQLKLGRTVITTSDPVIADFFRDRRDALHERGVTAMRLLGCCTAESSQAQQTIVELSRLVDLPVFGAVTVLSYREYDAYGFARSSDVLLVDQDHLGPIPECPLDADESVAAIKPADIVTVDAIPSVGWPVLVVPPEIDATPLFALFAGRAGISLPGILVEPDVEIVVPAGDRSWRTVQVLFGGRFVRVYPTGHPDGVLYPMPHASVGRIVRAAMPALD
jgi:hypothetical protein